VKGKLHLTFPERLINEPVIHRVGKDFDLVTNIRRANIEEGHAWVILEIEGTEESIAKAVRWLAEGGVKVNRVEGSW
jgi:L-aspartate semialdehyde sulfurtransferase ferredoxin